MHAPAGCCQRALALGRRRAGGPPQPPAAAVQRSHLMQSVAPSYGLKEAACRAAGRAGQTTGQPGLAGELAMHRKGQQQPTSTHGRHHPAPGRACTRRCLPSRRAGRAGTAGRRIPTRCQSWGWRCRRGCGRGAQRRQRWAQRAAPSGRVQLRDLQLPPVRAAASPLVARISAGRRAPGARGARSALADACLNRRVIARGTGLGGPLQGEADGQAGWAP